MKQDPLKPCPHCGGCACLCANYSHKTRSYFVFCKCDICGAQGKSYNSPTDPVADEWQNEACDGAAAAWNLRTSDIKQEATT